jgi:hypothetical protein
MGRKVLDHAPLMLWNNYPGSPLAFQTCISISKAKPDKTAQLIHPLFSGESPLWLAGRLFYLDVPRVPIVTVTHGKNNTVATTFRLEKGYIGCILTVNFLQKQ